MSNRTKVSFMVMTITIFLCIGVMAFAAKQDVQCGSDCGSCHELSFNKEKLQNIHRVLETCINCHDDSQPKMEEAIIPSFDHSGCGGHCGECHDSYPPDGNHVELKTCKRCHI